MRKSDQSGFRIMDFDKYTAYIASKADMSETNVSARSMTTMELLTDTNSYKQGELLWRIGLPVHGDPVDAPGDSTRVRQSACRSFFQFDYRCPAVYDIQQFIEFYASLCRSEKDDVRSGMVAIASDRRCL